MGNKFEYLQDKTVTKEVRYVSVMGNFKRYDFAFVEEGSKKLVIDLHKNRFAVLGKEEIEKHGEIEHIFHVTEMEADELRDILREIL
ncbi:SAV0927 family protein [Virgibacillus ndiopensis]|uniref:SAV0927 family protein n=1 Tax=Virgibacillus ndiopensis TaxID=2004408 RepID=UPI000C06F22D|nr:SAV0927 family protein [Virgibacillus ndiopensis]